MLSVAFAVVLVAAPAPRSFEEVLDETRLSGAPIVLDVFTSWCQPCKLMDAKVFPHPRVVKALEGLRFVRYDAEREPGVAVARRFDIASYPTVLVLTPDGHLVGKIHSQDVDGFVRELDTLLPTARVRVRAEPADDASATEWLLAGRAKARAEPERALEYFAKAVRQDPANHQRVASRAAVEAALLRSKLGAAREQARELAAYLEAWPHGGEAPAVLHVLAELTGKGALPKQALDRARARVVDAWVASEDVEQLNELVYLMLELGELGSAARLAARLEALAPEDAASLDTVAEVAFQSEDRARAVALSRKAVALAKDDEDLVANLRRYENEQPSLPALSPAPELEPGDPIGDRRALEKHKLQAQLRQRCPSQGNLSVVIRLYPTGERVARAAAFEPHAPASLLQCLAKVAVGLEYPALLERGFSDVVVNYGKRAR